jgi:RNA polymerase sigma-70 factor, ECF subfamily
MRPSDESEEFERAAAPYRRELLVHCYRMLGSYHDAEDAVQETWLRGWRGYERFEQRASVRTWLYRIATRVCLTALDGSARRVLPSGLGTGTDAAEVPWLEPLPDAVVTGDLTRADGDPEAVAVRRENIRLAFIAALQQLPPRQRAALVLCDVLSWPAADVAELLDSTVPSVNSALQRARVTMARPGTGKDANVDEQVLTRFVLAFERADIPAVAELLREDVALEMPPRPTWYAGRAAVLEFFAGHLHRTGRRRLVPTRANGCPAVGMYIAGEDGRLHAHSIQVLETVDDRIVRIVAFLDPGLFAAFALPPVYAED